MILWVASFPRSGNTMLRILLQQVFSLGSYCKYKSGNPNPNASWKNMGFKTLAWPEPTWKKTYDVLRQSGELCPVRTHDGETDGAKTIYIVRDGRSVLYSYYHFLQDLAGKKKVTLKKVISGRIGYGSWSQHLQQWDPFNRPDTLMVRYEDVLATPDKEIQRIEAFLGVSAVAAWENRFEEWHTAHPRFFRKGSPVPPTEEFSPAETELFWKHHGEWMNRLGYGNSVEIPAT